MRNHQGLLRPLFPRGMQLCPQPHPIAQEEWNRWQHVAASAAIPQIALLRLREAGTPRQTSLKCWPNGELCSGSAVWALRIRPAPRIQVTKAEPVLWAAAQLASCHPASTGGHSEAVPAEKSGTMSKFIPADLTQEAHQDTGLRPCWPTDIRITHTQDSVKSPSKQHLVSKIPYTNQSCEGAPVQSQSEADHISHVCCSSAFARHSNLQQFELYFDHLLFSAEVLMISKGFSEHPEVWFWIFARRRANIKTFTKYLTFGMFLPNQRLLNQTFPEISKTLSELDVTKHPYFDIYQGIKILLSFSYPKVLQV